MNAPAPRLQFTASELADAARAGVSPKLIARAQLPLHRPGAKRYDFAYVDAICDAYERVCARIRAWRAGTPSHHVDLNPT